MGDYLTPEEMAKRIDLGNDDRGLCCLRAAGGLCYEHGTIATAIHTAIDMHTKKCAQAIQNRGETIPTDNLSTFQLGFREGCLEMARLILSINKC